MRNKQRGVTAIELAGVLIFVAGIVGGGLLVWVAWHFIAKFW